MILEGIVTTLNADGSVNIAPMGPQVDEAMLQFVLLPFRTSTTCQNLRRHGEGVLHVTDDVWLLAQAAVGQPEPLPRLIAATAVRGQILADAARWYAFRVVDFDDREARARIVAQVVERGEQRPLFGFNRGKHAVVEAAILATRLTLLPAPEILAQLEHLRPLVEKTGGAQERTAFQFLEHYIRTHLSKESDG